jgi:hypothetical protein
MPTPVPTAEDEGRWLDNRGHLAAMVIIIVVGFLILVAMAAIYQYLCVPALQPTKTFDNVADGGISVTHGGQASSMNQQFTIEGSAA